MQHRHRTITESEFCSAERGCMGCTVPYCLASLGLAAASGHAVCFPLVARRVSMPTRAEILDILAASQTQVLAFFQGLSPQDL